MSANGVTWVRLSEIKTHPDFALFPIGKAERKAIAQSMREHGFDPAQPLVRWQETGYLVDGHTRLEAARDAAQTNAPVIDRPFEDWDAALDYAIARQRDRRNLTRQQLTAYVAHVVQAKDKAKPGRPGKTVPIGTVSAPSAAAIAEQLGVSRNTVQRTRDVLASGAKEVKTQLLAGEIAPSAAYAEVKAAERARADSAPVTSAPPTPVTPTPSPQPALIVAPAPPAPKAPASYSIAQWGALSAAERAQVIVAGRMWHSDLNKQKTDNIEWAQWSWNPVTGCLHNCPYCYARDLANRFYTQKFAPTFLPEKLGAPFHQRVPAQAASELGYRNIFTCSMADLFGKWVPAEWIEAVLGVVRDCPQWNFLFLTKFPNRLAEFAFPPNAWLGTSVDCQARVKNAERSFANVKGGVKWLSIEPMLEPLHFTSLDMFNWVVVGGASASTETPVWIPPRRWVLDLEAAARDAGCMIYEKTNLGIQGPSRFREYPGWQREETTLPPSLAYLPSIG